MGKEPFVRDNFAKGFMLSWYPLTIILGIDIYPYNFYDKTKSLWYI